jgi:hypothetical protein
MHSIWSSISKVYDLSYVSGFCYDRTYYVSSYLVIILTNYAPHIPATYTWLCDLTMLNGLKGIYLIRKSRPLISGLTCIPNLFFTNTMISRLPYIPMYMMHLDDFPIISFYDSPTYRARAPVHFRSASEWRSLKPQIRPVPLFPANVSYLVSAIPLDYPRSPLHDTFKSSLFPPLGNCQSPIWRPQHLPTKRKAEDIRK